MRLVELSTAWTIALDFVAWLVIHLGVSYLSLYVPSGLLRAERWLFRTRAWERGGALYQRLFRVKRWKASLPNGAAFWGRETSVQRLGAPDVVQWTVWVQESCRAELCHWVAMLPAPLFFLWNPWPVGVFMLLYALAMNAPCLIAQRYNRPRVLAALRHHQARLDQGTPTAALARARETTRNRS